MGAGSDGQAGDDDDELARGIRAEPARVRPIGPILPSTVFLTIVGFVPIGMTVLGFLVWEMRVGQAGHRLPTVPGEEEEDTGMVQRDDDRTGIWLE